MIHNTTIKKNLGALLLLLVMHHCSYATDWGFFRSEGFGLGFGRGVATHKFNPGDLNTFADSYNAFYPTLTQPFDQFKSNISGLSWQGQMYARMNYMYGSVSFLNTLYHYTNSARFANNFGRDIELEIDHQLLQFQFGATYKFIDVGVLFGTSWQYTTLYSYAVYGEGARSLGNEYALNGVFSNSWATLDYGIFNNVYLGPLQVEFRLYWGKPGFYGIDPELKELDDKTLTKLDGSGYFPSDLEKFFAPRTGQSNDDSNVVPAFHGMSWRIGLVYNLNFYPHDAKN